MVVGEVSSRTDVLVVGGGPGGYAAALRAAGLGLAVTLVERTRVGGTCLNVGCIPSKVLIHAAETADLARTSVGTGVTVTTAVDLPTLQTHLREVVSGLTGGVEHLLASAGVKVITGDARYVRPNRAVVVDGDSVQHVEFDHSIAATGSRPIELDAVPFDGVRVVDSTGALFDFDRIPTSLVVVGGGYIGVELGTAWAKLGSRVTIVEAAPALLPDLEPRLGRAVARSLDRLGVDVLTGARAVGTGERGLVIDIGSDGREQFEEIEAERMVVAVGRRPNTDDLGLEVMDATIGTDGRLVVDPGRRAAKRLLAIGDITAGPALAHKATAEAEVAARTAAGQAAVFDPAGVPAVVFSDPEVATVGLTVDQAREAGAEASSFVFPLSASARARTIGRPMGHVELVADGDGTVLGAHLAGAGVAELIGEVTLAIEMAATVDELSQVIHPHPTMSEGLLEAAHGALGFPLHVAGR